MVVYINFEYVWPSSDRPFIRRLHQNTTIHSSTTRATSATRPTHPKTLTPTSPRIITCSHPWYPWSTPTQKHSTHFSFSTGYDIFLQSMHNFQRNTFRNTCYYRRAASPQRPTTQTTFQGGVAKVQETVSEGSSYGIRTVLPTERGSTPEWLAGAGTGSVQLIDTPVSIIIFLSLINLTPCLYTTPDYHKIS